MTEFERGRAAGLAEAVEVLNAYREYDKPMCCDGRECGCQGASVFDTIEHYIRALAASPSDHVLVPRKLFTMVQVLALTPPDMWLSKDELHKNFDAEYRAAFPEKEESS